MMAENLNQVGRACGHCGWMLKRRKEDVDDPEDGKCPRGCPPFPPPPPE